MKKELKPLKIDMSRPEPTIQINKKVFERLQWLYNRERNWEEAEEYDGLLHLVFHTHEEIDNLLNEADQRDAL